MRGRRRVGAATLANTLEQKIAEQTMKSTEEAKLRTEGLGNGVDAQTGAQTTETGALKAGVRALKSRLADES